MFFGSNGVISEQAIFAIKQTDLSPKSTVAVPEKHIPNVSGANAIGKCVQDNRSVLTAWPQCMAPIRYRSNIDKTDGIHRL